MYTCIPCSGCGGPGPYAETEAAVSVITWKACMLAFTHVVPPPPSPHLLMSPGLNVVCLHASWLSVSADGHRHPHFADQPHLAAGLHHPGLCERMDDNAQACPQRKQGLWRGVGFRVLGSMRQHVRKGRKGA